MLTAIETKPLSPARQELREALAGIETARSAFEKAEKVAIDAASELEQCRTGLSVFDDLDEQMAKARLNALKGADPKVIDEMREAQRQRVLAKEDLTAAEKTLQLAQGEAANAKDALTGAEKARDRLVALIFSERVDEVIALIEELNSRREGLRSILKGLQMLVPGWEALQPTQLAQLMGAALSNAGLPSAAPEEWIGLELKILGALADKGNFPGTVGDLAKRKAEWKEFAEQILVDPAAEADPLLDRSQPCKVCSHQRVIRRLSDLSDEELAALEASTRPIDSRA